MKTKNISLLWSLILLCLQFTACDKLPKNGDLDGMWQVMTIERANVITDVADSQLYWSVQLHLVQYNTVDTHDIRFSHFNKAENTLTLYDFCYDSQNATSADNNEWIPITNSKDIEMYGITPAVDPINTERIRAVYQIETLNSNSMVLRNENERIAFRKI